jgi:hypothetical protein
VAVLEKHASDPEIYSYSINSLGSMATFPRYCAKMAEAGHVHAILQGFKQYWTELVSGGSAETESGPVERTLQLLQHVLRLGPEAFVETGGLDCLIGLISTKPPPGRRGVEPKPPQSPAVMYLAMQLLERVSRSKVGQERLANVETVGHIVNVCGIKYTPAPKKTNAATVSVDESVNPNQHLDPSFRVMDRLSRNDRGLATLRA